MNRVSIHIFRMEKVQLSSELDQKTRKQQLKRKWLPLAASGRGRAARIQAMLRRRTKRMTLGSVESIRQQTCRPRTSETSPGPL